MNYGKIAYEAYCKKREQKSVKGKPLPHFEEQTRELQEAWNEAGKAIVEAIQLQTSPQ